VTLAQAIEGMDRLGQQLEKEYHETNTGHGAHVMRARDWYVTDFKASLIALSAGVGFVLLIACVNVANLLLVRAASRAREMAVRAALGAGRARLIVQSLSESLGLSLVGGVVGIGVALLALQALPVVMPERMSVVGVADLSPDWRVLLFAFGLSLLTGILFGVLPALQASRPRLADALGQGGRGAAGVRRGARLTLVIGEIALATLTLVGAGLVIRSFSRILATPLGFSADHRLTLRVIVAGPRYASGEARRLALAQIEQSLAGIPGVTHAGAIDLPPLSGLNSRQGMNIEGRSTSPEDPPTRMHPRVVTPGYYQAMGIDIVKGRAFTAQDDGRAEPVVIISETAARQFWPDVDPIGRRVSYGGEEIWRRVVGVARDVRHWGRATEINPMIYRPQAQVGTGALTFVLATNGDPGALAAAARARIAAVDPNLPLTSVRTLADVASRSVQAERAVMVLMSGFGALALLLAVIGIYGVMAQLVVVRVPEIGVRMTLGARPLDILRGLLFEGLWQAVAGLAIGLVAGVYLMKFAGKLLFNVRPWDPITLTGVGLLLIAAALAACLIPARRAMRIDPAAALRQG
jgi:putative ABC transport system permease protein